MDFKPCTEKEISERRLMPKGTYEFEIVDACEKLSKNSGKPMIELRVRVIVPNGVGRIITDYLLEQRAEKLRHAAEVCGVLDRYMSGSLSDRDFLHKKGKLKLGIEKDKLHKYPDKNIILDYVCASSASGERGGVRAYIQ
jgi:hypothetical protein